MMSRMFLDNDHWQKNTFWLKKMWLKSMYNTNMIPSVGGNLISTLDVTKTFTFELL